MPKSKVKKTVKKSVKRKANKKDRLFLGSPLSEWAEIKMNFVNVLKKWPEKDIARLEAAIRKLDGYIIGNLDFCISMPLDEIKELKNDPIFSKQPDIAAMFKARMDIGR